MKKQIQLISFILILGACSTNSRSDKSVNVKQIGQLENWPTLSKDYVLGQPPSIDIDSKKNIYVFQRAKEGTALTEEGVIKENAILVLAPSSGEIISSWGANMFKKPHGLSIDADNNIWLTDLKLQQVFKFSPNGELLLTLGEKDIAGEDESHFDQPTDAIASPDGFIYVTDGYGNNRVVKFTADGKYVGEWGTVGSSDGEFNLPHAIDIDKTGNLYIADRENKRVQMFDPDGTWLKTWSDPSFGSIQSLKITDDGKTLYLVDYKLTKDKKPKGSDIIRMDTENGEFVRLIRSEDLSESPSRYHDIVIDSAGDIYVADIIKNTILKFSRE